MSKMYSHGSLEMNDLFGDSSPSPLLVTVSDDQHSFENETESLYMTQLEGLGQLTSPEGKEVMSSLWNADLCGSLLLHPREQPRQPKRIGSVMAMVKPEDVTGQTVKKEEVFEVEEVSDPDEMAIVEANFDLSTLADATPLAESTMVEETQETIEDMAAFLKSYEAAPAPPSDHSTVQAAMPCCLADELLSLEQRRTLDQMDTTVPDDDGLAAVEALCDNLLAANNPETTPEQTAATDILQVAVDSEGLADSGYQTLFTEDLPLVSQEGRYTVSNISHCVTPDGQKVIIVVQRPDPEASQAKIVRSSSSPSKKMVLPKPPPEATTAEDDDDSDSSWTPRSQEQPKRKPGRKRVVSAEALLDQVHSAGKVVKKSYRNIKDRKERKKWQNVEAARRYRLKKKQEEEEMEAEEEVQRARQDQLKEQLKDVQSELNTLKKLMKEMGMLKVVRR